MTLSNRIIFKLKKIKQNLLVFLSQRSVLRGNKKFTKFIILTRSRSGSNLLVSYLESHPNIYIRGEIFHNLNNRNYRKILNWFFNIMPSKFKASGFKIFYYHPLDTKCPELWQELASNADIKIIHLYRKNLIKTIISRHIALKTDIWSSEKKNLSVSFNLDIPPQLIDKEINRTLAWREEYNNIFNKHKIFEINYEDFIGASHENLSMIQDFIEVPRKTLSTHLKKQQTKPLEEVVNNYNEIKVYFKKTIWKKYL